jgi:hypothetical protein
MTKEELIQKYLEHRWDQAMCAARRFNDIKSGDFYWAMHHQFEMHYHQDEMEKISDYIYENEWNLDLLRARWVW